MVGEHLAPAHPPASKVPSAGEKVWIRYFRAPR